MATPHRLWNPRPAKCTKLAHCVLLRETGYVTFRGSSIFSVSDQPDLVTFCVGGRAGLGFGKVGWVSYSSPACKCLMVVLEVSEPKLIPCGRPLQTAKCDPTTPRLVDCHL